jgi:hypothetical protein
VEEFERTDAQDDEQGGLKQLPYTDCYDPSLTGGDMCAILDGSRSGHHRCVSPRVRLNVFHFGKR